MRLSNPVRTLIRRILHPARRPIRNGMRARPRLEEFEPKVVPNGAWTQIQEPPSVGNVGDMLLLADGEVMAQAGTSNLWFRLTADTSGNYADVTWVAAASMSMGRERFAANVLPDGRVVVLGGEHTSPVDNRFTSSGETYDPAANTWTSLDPFPGPPAGSNPDDLGNGPSPTELLPGDGEGAAPQPDGQLLVGSFWSPQTYLLNPAVSAGATTSLQWDTQPRQKVGTPGTLRSDNSGEQSYITLPDHTVLDYDIHASESVGFTADQFFPVGQPVPPNGTPAGAAGQWADASQTSGTVQILSDNNVNQENGAPILLPADAAHPEGRVFWLGGNGNTAYFDVSTRLWSAGPRIEYRDTQGDLHTFDAADAPAALLPGGDLLVAASQGYLSGTTVLLDFNPGTGIYTPLGSESGSPFPDLSHAKVDQMSMLVLPNGHLMLSAGNQLWDFAPGGASPTQAPHISGIGHQNYDGTYDGQPNADGSYNVTGTYLTGFSEGAAQGDQFNGVATNYPIVRLTLQPPPGSNEPATVWYANTTGWTPGVDDSISRTIQFTPPPNLPAGTYTVTVAASGISSVFDPSISISTTGPLYADSSWAGVAAGTAVVADPVTGAMGTIDSNCFSSIGAALADAGTGAANIVVNGANGGTGSGSFGTEIVSLNTPVTLYLQNGAVNVAFLTGSDSAATVVLNGSTLSLDDQTYSDNGSFAGSIFGSGGLTMSGIAGEWDLLALQRMG